jgi:hypothetical protein
LREQVLDLPNIPTHPGYGEQEPAGDAKRGQRDQQDKHFSHSYSHDQIIYLNSPDKQSPNGGDEALPAPFCTHDQPDFRHTLLAHYCPTGGIRKKYQCIALAEQRERERGYAVTLDPDFAADVEEIVRNRKPWNPPSRG